MYSARNRNAVIADDTFQVQDWLRSNGNRDHGVYPAFDFQHRIRPLSPVKRHRISTTDGKGPDRRRQLKSMESLLGLSDENLNGKNLNSEVVTRASPDVQDSLDRALMDFEETLELAFQSNSIVPPPRGFTNHSLVEGDESNFNKLDSSFESSTTGGSSGYSTKPDQSTHRSINTYNELQLVREQMIKSLEIIKDLEEQVKLVPMLKAQVSSLNLEKQRLSSELDRLKKIENTADSLANGRRGGGSGGVATREVGVSCVPICRDVGVTTPPKVSSTSASTMTEENQKKEAAAAVAWERHRPSTAATYTQTADAAKPPIRVDAGTQSSRATTVQTVAVGVTARPRMYDASVAVKPTSKHVGCSADLPPLTSAAAQPTPPTPPSPPPGPTVVPITRTTQTDAVGKACVVHARGTQTATGAGYRAPVSRTTQTEGGHSARVAADGTTQTDAMAVVVADAPTEEKPATAVGRRPVATTIGRRSNSFHHYTIASPAVTSKIPRPKQHQQQTSTPPVTPVLNRKSFTRQDTYTKQSSDLCDDPIAVQQQHKPSDAKSNISLASELQNGLPEADMNFKPIRDDLNKDNPSKEMRGALKVLNDSLKKTTATLLPRAQLKQAIDIVREEWFKVTSSSDCGGNVVKNYVNWFTSYSPVLLEFIVNMTDAAGNTVLHYAISHGNFDVVLSILDTGVCNVNLTNDAGYSSVMLVSLAEIKNDDELKIIKRLFKCGDVNLQAKKHGQTTLMLAVSHGKAEVVKLLLECGADVNIQDEDGSTALMCAAEHGLQEVVNILLSCPECDVSIADNDGSTALSIAMEAGHKEIGIALYAKQHILSRENSPFNLSKSKRSRSANTVMPSAVSYSHLPLKKSPSLQPREYATLSSMLKTRIP